MNCPLCDSPKTISLEELDTRLLTKLYRQRLGIAVAVGNDDLELFRCDSCELKFYAPAPTGDAAFYEQLQQFGFYYLGDKEEYDIAGKHVLPGDDVLEIGSGRGAFKHKLDCASYVGLEFSTSAIAEAKRDKIEILNETIEHHTQGNAGRYDVVCSFQVLEHVSDVSSFLGSAIRCLKPGGRLIISVPNEDGFMGRETNNILNMPPHHVTRWSAACLRRIPDFFPVSVVDVEQDELAAMHISSYTNSEVIQALCRLSGRRPGILSAFWSGLLPRIVAKALSLLMTPRIRRIRTRLPGHSVTAIYVHDQAGSFG